MGGDRIELDWPERQRVYLTIDYECDYGTALEENSYQAIEYTADLVELLERLEIPLTCFVQTEVLETKPAQVERLRNADFGISFHPHSHTHRPRNQTDVAREVQRSAGVYEDYFGRAPVGYRFPNGNLRPEDYSALAEAGYEFDASVFPSWRPGHFDNRDASLTPLYLPEHDLYEVPFTVYSDGIRIPTALSYCRLLGRPFTELLLRRPPSTVIFNIHMHDLVNPESYERLSPFYRGIYARNTDGLSLLERVLERVGERGYQFEQIDDIYDRIAREQTASASAYSR